MWGRALVASILVLGLLSGCAANVPSSTPTPSTTPTPTPTPTPAEATPVQPFGGECGNVLGPDRLTTVLDADAVLQETEPDAYTIALGVLECEWWSESVGRDLSIHAFPAEVVSPEIVAAYSEPICEWDYDIVVCKVGGTSAGVWIAAQSAEPQYAMPEEPPELISAALALAAAAAGDHEPGRSFSPGVPAEKLDCTQLGEAVGVAELVGQAAVPGFPTGGVNAGLVPRIAIDAGVYEWCAWTVYDLDQWLPYVWYEVYRFAGWAWDSIPAFSGDELEPIDVPGAVAARFDPQYGHVVATDGIHVVSVSTGDGVDVVDAAARMLQALQG